MAQGPSADLVGFVHSRGYQKKPFLKVDWSERLKDHDLNKTSVLEPRSRRAAVAGNHVMGCPLVCSRRSCLSPLHREPPTLCLRAKGFETLT
jgi:hypothetical protein